MSSIIYTSTGSFWYGIDTYYGQEKDSILLINPMDPSSYSYNVPVNYQFERKFVLTEDQEGWCTDCTFIFAVRTTKETSWSITAELGYGASAGAV